MSWFNKLSANSWYDCKMVFLYVLLYSHLLANCTETIWINYSFNLDKIFKSYLYSLYAICCFVYCPQIKLLLAAGGLLFSMLFIMTKYAGLQTCLTHLPWYSCTAKCYGDKQFFFSQQAWYVSKNVFNITLTKDPCTVHKVPFTPLNKKCTMYLRLCRIHFFFDNKWHFFIIGQIKGEDIKLAVTPLGYSEHVNRYFFISVPGWMQISINICFVILMFSELKNNTGSPLMCINKLITEISWLLYSCETRIIYLAMGMLKLLLVCCMKLTFSLIGAYSESSQNVFYHIFYQISKKDPTEHNIFYPHSCCGKWNEIVVI